MFKLSDRRKYRLLEMIPAVLVWSTFILAIVLSFVKPLWVVYFIIIFDLYWLMRVSYFVFYMLLAWRSYKRDIARNWFSDLEHEHPDWRRLHHLIFLPTYGEDLEVMETTIKRDRKS